MTLNRTVVWQGFDNPLLMAQAWSLRHRVFQEELGWNVASHNNLEWDHFDRWAFHCCAVENERVVAYWRALPTEQPYLLEQSFQLLLCGKPLPRQRDIWEISRFLVAPDHQNRDGLGRLMVRAAGDFGLQVRANQLLAVVEPPFARFIRASGLPIRMESKPMVVGTGHQGDVRAVLISLDIHEYATASGAASLQAA